MCAGKQQEQRGWHLNPPPLTGDPSPASPINADGNSDGQEQHGDGDGKARNDGRPREPLVRAVNGGRLAGGARGPKRAERTGSMGVAREVRRGGSRERVVDTHAPRRARHPFLGSGARVGFGWLARAVLFYSFINCSVDRWTKRSQFLSSMACVVMIQD